MLTKIACLGLALVVGSSVMEVSPLLAQGMISAPLTAGAAEEEVLGALVNVNQPETVTMQRLLRRLGYLTDANMTREFDKDTVEALAAHFEAVKKSPRGLKSDGVLRSLFLAAWQKEGWGTGQVDGQELVVEPAEVKIAQQSLKQLGYEPGPVDGVFGPATFSAIEIFQEDNGMKVTGVLTRNMQHNITRTTKFVGKAPKSVIHMFNWADYVNPDVLDAFEKETNIRIVHEEFDSSSETAELLSQGSDKYDVMVQDGPLLRQIVEEGAAVERLDRAKLPNAQFIDSAASNYTDALDPGNLHSLPYLWGTTGFGLNNEKIRKFSPTAPTNSLAMILDPKYAAELSKCGISLIDEPTDIIPILAGYVGADMRNLSIGDLETLDQALAKVATYVKVIPVDSFINALSDGKYCVAMGYSGDVYAARDRAAQNKTGIITYAVPKEGSQLWFDLLVIPAKAKNKEGAYQLMNYLMRPDVAAATTNYLQYANAIKTSSPFIEPGLLNDPGLYPPKSVLARLAVQPPLPDDVEKVMKKIWERLAKAE
jgi:putrescine transport system substrate-binding protein